MVKANTSVLILTTYPIKRSFHGGQRRVKAIADAYVRAGHKVVHSAIFNPPSYAHANERGRWDLEAPALTAEKIKAQPILEDIILGESCYEDPVVKAHLIKLITEHPPAYIDLHQPYLYIGLRRLLAELTISPKIIFSSQNIEYKMKQEIYLNHADELSDKLAKKSISLLKDTEILLSREAALVTAVSEADVAEHKKMGAKRVLLIPNGIEPSSTTAAHRQKWQDYFKLHGINKPMLFTGSAHPPNWKGFLDLMGGRLGFLPITSRLMIVGDIGPALEYVLHRNDPVYASSFWLRAHSCGRLDDNDLGALIELSDTIILPITEGGGSNLKAAEAIYSGKKIVASGYSMRGYDEFRGFPNIFIENDPLAFKARLVEVLAIEQPTLTDAQLKQTRNVLWEARTKPLGLALEELK